MNNVILHPLTLHELETLILNQCRKALSEATTEPATAPDEFLTITQAAELLRVSVPTVYGYVHKRLIPHMKRSGKLYFSRKEVSEWLRASRKSTAAEIHQQTVESLKRAE